MFIQSSGFTASNFHTLAGLEFPEGLSAYDLPILLEQCQATPASVAPSVGHADKLKSKTSKRKLRPEDPLFAKH